MATKIDQSGFAKKMKALASVPHEVMKQALTVFVANTPKRSGNARRSTRLDNQDVIQAQYNYASKLDAGSSKQSPQGMTKPTIKEIQKLIKSTTAKVVK
jgi:response regulator of citrate/malate metabolism